MDRVCDYIAWLCLLFAPLCLLPLPSLCGGNTESVKDEAGAEVEKRVQDLENRESQLLLRISELEQELQKARERNRHNVCADALLLKRAVAMQAPAQSQRQATGRWEYRRSGLLGRRVQAVWVTFSGEYSQCSTCR